jgi:hypothetical protein
LEENLLGCFNGLTSAGWVEDNAGQIVEEIHLNPEIDQDGEQFFPSFDKSDFVKAGYSIVSGERAEDFCKYPDNW